MMLHFECRFHAQITDIRLGWKLSDSDKRTSLIHYPFTTDVISLLTDTAVIKKPSWMAWVQKPNSLIKVEVSMSTF